MRYRLTTQLMADFQIASLPLLPLADDPLTDWTLRSFVTARKQYVIVTNTLTLYSALLPARGLRSDRQLFAQALVALRDVMDRDDLSMIYTRHISPHTEEVELSKALNRSVTSSMSDLILHAKDWLAAEECTQDITAERLNNIPFAPLKYRTPREAFRQHAG